MEGARVFWETVGVPTADAVGTFFVIDCWNLVLLNSEATLDAN
jgi:hypothetical protein